MTRFHDFMRLRLIGLAQWLIRWSNWHHERMPQQDLPWKVPEPGFLSRASAEWDFIRLDSMPSDKRTYQ